jgi:hypothetical protein
MRQAIVLSLTFSFLSLGTLAHLAKIDHLSHSEFPVSIPAPERAPSRSTHVK